MTGDNPYAPPTVSEPESVLICSGDGWKLLDDILLVRCGVTLPMVDLQSGVRDESLQVISLSPASTFEAFRKGGAKAIHAYASRKTRMTRISRSIREVLFIVALIVFPLTGHYTKLDGFPITLFGMVLVLSFFDKPRPVIENSVTSGWLRITNLHPLALAYLRDIADKKDLRYYPQSP